MKIKKQLLVLIACLLGVAATRAEEVFHVSSPDGTIQVTVRLTDRIYYSLDVDGREVMALSPLSMVTNQGTLGNEPVLKGRKEISVDQEIETVWGIRNVVPDKYNQLELELEGGYSILFRVYDDGMAYRFVTGLKGELIVWDEIVEYRFHDNHLMINHVVDSYTTPYEMFYTRQRIREMHPENLVSLPSVVALQDLKLAILEADLFEYPGMYLSKRTAHSWDRFCGKFPGYPLKQEPGGTRRFNMVVTERADYIAKTSGSRSFPWRVIEVARTDTDLLDSDLVYRLARPAKIKTDWIRPGKVSWDWWNALNLEGVDFVTGVNTLSYKYFIDFAADHNISYVIFDEWWSDQFDLFLPNPQVDMEFLTSYARERGVGIILWAVWHTIDRQKDEVFEKLRDWGIAGVKVDFINRDDQLAIEFYENFVREAARYQLLVDYHGCSKPTGLHRTYPNMINYEGVRGNEFNKFSEQPDDPGHNVDILYTRMLAGPMDYTPGAMDNSIEGDFNTQFENPMSCGTRCHQLGMYVLYYAPLQMLCDAPTQYEKYPDILSFLSNVPTTWDETRALDGELGEFAVIARKKGNDWYIGGLNNWTEREVEINLADFTDGPFSMEIFRDGINANRRAEDYIHEREDRMEPGMLKITMKKGGGFAVILREK